MCARLGSQLSLVVADAHTHNSIGFNDIPHYKDSLYKDIGLFN